MGVLDDLKFGNFIDGLRTANHEDGLRAAADRFASSLGFKFFAYFSKGQDMSVVTSYPKAWQARYFSMNYHRVDPVLSPARFNSTAFNWSDRDLAKSREQKMFFGEARDLGIVGGVTVPIAGSFGRVAAMTFAGPDQDRRDVLEACSLDFLKLGALYFDAHHGAKTRLQRKAIPQKLTAREQHILMWVARGKTMIEIADLLEIRRTTIAFHLTSARRKLGAVTLPQAVGLAIKSDEISI